MIRVEEYLTGEDESPFRKWFDALDGQAAAFVAIAIDRQGDGNRSNVKPIGKALPNCGSVGGQATASISAGRAGRW